MRPAFVLTVGVLSCSEAPAAPPDATLDATLLDAAADLPAELGADVGPPLLSTLRCGAPALWAEPLRDYLAVGERQTMGGAFLRAVQDLAVYDDRLYLGYGDANINLGRATPIEVRSFRDDGAAEAAAEFRSDEEQLEQYRELDGDLWIAGVDATEDAWLGNVYWRPRATPGGGGFARGAVNVGGALVHRAFRVDAGGAARVIERFNGRRVLDVFRHAPTGEVVVLSAELDEYPAEPLVWSMRVEVTADFERFTELASATGDEAFRAVAAWRGRLYFGTDGGAVLRCDLAP